MLSLPAYVQSLRRDVRLLRVHNALLLRSSNISKKNQEALRKEIRELEKERERLRKENERLKKEVEKFTKTTNRYQVALFDHGNFHHPDHKDTKPKGGQLGHTDTNRDHAPASPPEKKRLFAATCGHCGTSLSRVNAVREKLLLDIILSPAAVRFLLAAERQWCPSCQKEVQAKHPQSLPFTEYGLNVFLLVLFLRFRCLLSFTKIGAVTALFGLPLAPSTIVNLLSRAKQYLEGRYDDLVHAVQRGDIIYSDETGWMVRGKNAWLWVMGNEDVTVYKGAESRGKGIFKEMYGTSCAYSMHDGYAVYEGVTGKDTSLYCWSHLLRFCYEETHEDPDDSGGVKIRDALVSLYQEKRSNPSLTVDEVTKRMDALCTVDADQSSVTAIQERLRVQKDGLIRALFLTPDGTNNLSERNLRPLAIMRYLSSGSDTYTGMETTAMLASVVHTQLKQKPERFIPDMNSYVRTGLHQLRGQYRHVSTVEDYTSVGKS